MRIKMPRAQTTVREPSFASESFLHGAVVAVTTFLAAPASLSPLALSLTLR